MTTTKNPAGTIEQRMGGSWRWQDAAGLAAPAVALALWALLLTGIAAPLGAALAQLDGANPPASAGIASPGPCPLPPGALASATPPVRVSCR